jgi:hypothetical protein
MKPLNLREDVILCCLLRAVTQIQGAVIDEYGAIMITRSKVKK